MAFLQRIPYSILVPAAIFLGLAPFVPEPHLLGKLEMLFSGTLSRPVDIFDLLMHSAPLLLLMMKWLVEKAAKP